MAMRWENEIGSIKKRTDGPRNQCGGVCAPRMLHVDLSLVISQRNPHKLNIIGAMKISKQAIIFKCINDHKLKEKAI